MRYFTISFPDARLSVEEVWPDGDAPADPTAEDVANVMRQCGGFHGVVNDWSLLHELTVWPDPSTRGAGAVVR